jgi:hypothetical protein
VQRVVPWGDRPEHADRLANDQRVADLLLPGDLLDQLRHRVEGHRRQAGLDPARELQRHPQLGGDGGGDLIAALAEPGTYRRQQLGTLLARGLRPAIERLARGIDRSVDVGRGRSRDRSHRLFGGRVDDLDALGADRVDPLAADEELLSYVLLGCRGQTASYC